MKLYFITGNIHKLNEAEAVFSEFNIEIEQLKEDKHEPKEMNLKQVSEFNADYFYKKYKKPIIVDDTGVFFKAYPEFPGNHPKLMFELLGYKGLLKLLENEERGVQFRTVVSYCDENGLKSFTGKLDSIADNKVNDLDKELLPYERILLVNNKPISQFSRQEKNAISHRAKAFRKLAIWLNKRSY